MTQIMYLWSKECTLRQTAKQLILPQLLQYLSQVLFMFLLITRIYQDVIQEHNHKPIQKGAKDSIHEAHEYSWSVRETKWHHSELVVTIPSTESYLRDITIHNPQLMITRLKINL